MYDTCLLLALSSYWMNISVSSNLTWRHRRGFTCRKSALNPKFCRTSGMSFFACKSLILITLTQLNIEKLMITETQLCAKLFSELHCCSYKMQQCVGKWLESNVLKDIFDIDRYKGFPTLGTVRHCIILLFVRRDKHWEWLFCRLE